MSKKIKNNILKIIPIRTYDRTNECYVYEDGTILDIVGIRCKDLNIQSSDELERDMLQLTQFFSTFKDDIKIISINISNSILFIFIFLFCIIVF